AVGALAVVPVVEELAFRGYLARRIVDRDFTRVEGTRIGALAIGVSAVAFGLMHDRVLAATVAGIAYGLALRRRGEVADAVAAHATTNALLLAWVAATGRWDLWG
ncbi:MAG: CAAX prenyl protease-related protein, partial [Alphaproteobacteria bacterium]